MRVRVVSGHRRVLLSIPAGSTVGGFSERVAAICELEEAPALFLDGFRLLEFDDAARVLRDDDTIVAGGATCSAMSVVNTQCSAAKRRCLPSLSVRSAYCQSVDARSHASLSRFRTPSETPSRYNYSQQHGLPAPNSSRPSQPRRSESRAPPVFQTNVAENVRASAEVYENTDCAKNVRSAPSSWELPSGKQWPSSGSEWDAIEDKPEPRLWKGEFLRYSIVEFKDGVPTLSKPKIGFVDNIMFDPLRLVLVSKSKVFDVVESTSIHQPMLLRNSRRVARAAETRPILPVQKVSARSERRQIPPSEREQVPACIERGDAVENDKRIGVESEERGPSEKENERQGNCEIVQRKEGRDERLEKEMDQRKQEKDGDVLAMESLPVAEQTNRPAESTGTQNRASFVDGIYRHPQLGDLEVPAGEDPDKFISMKLRRLRQAVKRQVEYYFSEENLRKDKFLISAQDEDGYVRLSLICSFNRVKSLCTDRNFIVECLVGSEVVEVCDKHIRRRP